MDINEIEELLQEKKELEERVYTLESQVGALEDIIKPLAIGSEQLWEVVFKDCLDRPVPHGVDLRPLVENL